MFTVSLLICNLKNYLNTFLIWNLNKSIELTWLFRKYLAEFKFPQRNVPVRTLCRFRCTNFCEKLFPYAAVGFRELIFCEENKGLIVIGTFYFNGALIS
jgi:hypothetical protein